MLFTRHMTVIRTIYEAFASVAVINNLAVGRSRSAVTILPPIDFTQTIYVHVKKKKKTRVCLSRLFFFFHARETSSNATQGVNGGVFPRRFFFEPGGRARIKGPLPGYSHLVIVHSLAARMIAGNAPVRALLASRGSERHATRSFAQRSS